LVIDGAHAPHWHLSERKSPVISRAAVTLPLERILLFDPRSLCLP
jgi:hypothetical protein